MSAITAWLRGIPARLWTRYGIVPLCVACGLAILFFLNPTILRELELKLLDQQFRLRGKRTLSVPVKIVAIDDASLEKVGRWPWPRTTLARLFAKLAEGKPRVVGLDVILAEP
jgi:adenylate cyclase